jgi:hypothetical protein
MGFARNTASVLLAGALAACATAPAEPVAASSPSAPATAAPPPPAPPRPTSGDIALAIIQTPFLIAIKVPLCVLTAVVAAPLGAAATMADSYQGWDTRHDLADGLERNCGPPGVL